MISGRLKCTERSNPRMPSQKRRRTRTARTALIVRRSPSQRNPPSPWRRGPVPSTVNRPPVSVYRHTWVVPRPARYPPDIIHIVGGPESPRSGRQRPIPLGAPADVIKPIFYQLPVTFLPGPSRSGRYREWSGDRPPIQCQRATRTVASESVDHGAEDGLSPLDRLFERLEGDPAGSGLERELRAALAELAAKRPPALGGICQG